MQIPTVPMGSIPRPLHRQPAARVLVGSTLLIQPEGRPPVEARDRVHGTALAAPIFEGR